MVPRTTAYQVLVFICLILLVLTLLGWVLLHYVPLGASRRHLAKLDAYELGLLSGGRRHAVTVALSGLVLKSAVTKKKGRIFLTCPAPSDALDDIEAVIVSHLSERRTAGARLRELETVCSPSLRDRYDNLFARGFLSRFGEAVGSILWLLAAGMVVLPVLGAGSPAAPRGRADYIAGAAIWLATAAALWFGDRDNLRRTTLGDRVLATVRRDHSADLAIFSRKWRLMDSDTAKLLVGVTIPEHDPFRS